ncbi:MAG: hypothetical protein WBB22_08665, partial [Anaerolineae bacterium]
VAELSPSPAPPETATPSPSPQCTVVLDEDTLDRLTVSMDPMDQTVEMRPGETRTFSLGVIECCYILEPVKACATWSVDPPEGASIDPDTGLFTVDAQGLSGSVFTVSADVENGRRVVSVEVHVFTPEDNPLVGLWREEAQFACSTGEEVVPEQPIGELRFRADSSFRVTWMPFEIYVDYWGTYAYDLPRGTLDLVITGGNYVPDDKDATGSFSIDEDGRLILDGIWLGSPTGGPSSPNCGHGFMQ